MDKDYAEMHIAVLDVELRRIGIFNLLSPAIVIDVHTSE
jgi:hypothetical protein